MRASNFQALAATALLVASTLSGGAAAAGGNPLSYGKPDFDLTGTAYDATTKQPIEGAYVVAIFYKSVVGLGGSDTWCVKTKGMYTGNDGKFSFPIEKRDGRSPGEVTAIKPGYYTGRVVFPRPEVWKKQGREAYSGRDTPLVPQDPAKPEWQYGSNDVFCARAATREDASAGIEFLRIELGERKRLKSNPIAIESTANMIRHLESLPMSGGQNK
jgi:hypothetical protein